MRTIGALLLVSSLWTPALAAVAPRLEKSDRALEVELSQIVGSTIKAAMTNTGSAPLKLLDYNTLMDKNAVHKLSVTKDGVEVPFKGLDVAYKASDIPEDVFTTLEPDESFESIINIAALHDITGGDYVISARGAIPYAAMDRTRIVGSVPYSSNKLSVSIEPSEVELVPESVSMLGKRVTATNCDGEKGEAFRKSKTRLVRVARRVARAARTGSAERFAKFFKTKDKDIREAVAARLTTIANEAETEGGLATYYCEDPNGYCDPQALAYTLPSDNVMANCPLFYELSELGSDCGGQDQVVTILHQLLHAPAVIDPPTQDLAPSLDASLDLDQQAAFLNSDSYVLYVNAVVNQCE